MWEKMCKKLLQKLSEGILDFKLFEDLFELAKDESEALCPGGQR